MTELIGDSTRDGRWSLVRLEVEGERIVSAEAEGLERPLEGLTLLEAAAVGGDELAVDALANALAPARSASPFGYGSTRRVRTPSAPAARPRPCSRHVRPATGSACPT